MGQWGLCPHTPWMGRCQVECGPPAVYNRRLMGQTVVTFAAQALHGIRAGVRARWGLLVSAAVAVVLLDILVPPILLSVVRKPVDYFTFNPWLTRLPDYLWAGRDPLTHRLEKTWDLALFWFSSDSLYGGVDWGFAVTVSDLARFMVMGVLIGTYFAVLAYERHRTATTQWSTRIGAKGGMLGAASSVFGLATGGCTVMGCGAPVIPVVGLAFAGLSSTTLKWLSGVSMVATPAVLIGMAAGVLYLASRAGASIAER